MPPYLRLLFLILIILVSTVVVTFVGAVIAVPVYGYGILEQMESLENVTDPENIAILKYFQIISQIGTFIIPAILFAFLVSPNRNAYLQLDKRPHIFPAIATILLLFTALPAVNWLMEINETLNLPNEFNEIEQWMRKTEEQAGKLTESFLVTSSFKAFLVNFLMIAILPAVGEELIFRGILIREFDNWLNNKHLAVIISAFLFSALHLQFYGFLPRFALGLMFGYLFIWTGSLWIPMLAHFVNNGTAVIIAYLVGAGIVKTDVESFGSAGENGSLILGSFIFTILLIIAVKTFVKRKEKKFT